MHDPPEKILIIIPCYNESQRLQMPAFAAQPAHQTFLFVDDGSVDGTTACIQKHLNANIHLLSLKTNVGKAEAIRQGVIHGKQLPHFDQLTWIGFWDADLATPLSEIDNFIQFSNLFAQDIDAVWGSRIHRLGASINRSFLRHVLGRCFATLITLVLDIKSYDSQCGAKIFKKAVLIRCVQEKFISRWIFDVEILLRLQQQKIIEYPLQQWHDVKGGKLNVWTQAFQVLKDIYKIKSHYQKILR